VLQHMRDAGPPVWFIEEPSLDVGHHGNDRRRVVGLNQESQAVGEDFADNALCPKA
jgi:hypothetical protein